MSIVTIHLVAGIKSIRQLRCEQKQIEKDYHFICAFSDIKEGEGRTICIDDQNIALFKHQNQVYAVDSICRHQLGPLGEGKIVDGCITCPWHGYQYLPHNGQSPPPFSEKLSTYEVKVVNQKICLNPMPLTKGTPI
ncbi:MAG: Rieske (2Fe-2S) protein [Flavobacteriaceae bacterium]